MKPKILALSHLFPNAKKPVFGIFVYYRLRAIQKYCDVRVIAPIKRYPFSRKVVSKNSDAWPNAQDTNHLITFYPGFTVIPRIFKWFDSISYWRAIRPIVKKLLNEKFDFNIIDVHWSYPDILAAYILAKQRNCPFIVTIRGKKALYAGRFSIRRWLLNSLLKKANAIIALSSELKSMLKEIGIPDEKIHVILNGIDTSVFRHIDRAEARKALNIPEKGVFIISVGSLIKGKGHHELIKIMPELIRKHNATLYIIGSAGPAGNYEAPLKELARKTAPEKIHFIEEITHQQLCYWYNAADLFCLATKSEGCPNVVLESLACGTPVVVTDVGAVKDFIIDGENGFVSPDSDQMESKIDAALLNVRWNRNNIANGMKEKNWDSCARKVLSVYDSVLK